MKSILITGCNRGIGLGLVKKLVQIPNAPENIFATCRDINKATALNELANQSNKINIIQIDLRNTNEYGRLVKEVQNKVDGNGLNVLINSAGVATKFHRINMVREEDLVNSFHINTVAPIMLTKALLPLLKKASSNAEKQPLGVSRAAVVNISTVLASITDNNIGGFYPYRCSKVALNMATRSLNVDLKDYGILAVCLHPGWVKTDIGGPNAKITVEESADGIIQTLTTLNQQHNGAFIDYTGKTINW